MGSLLRALVVTGLASGLLACRGGVGAAASPHPAVRLVEMRLGRALTEDKRVRQPEQVFWSWDTFYLSVETDGELPRAVLRARWTRGMELLAETELVVAADGRAVSEFHLSRAGGWPPGEYAVELLVDQVPAGRLGFSVRETP